MRTTILSVAALLLVGLAPRSSAGEPDQKPTVEVQFARQLQEGKPVAPGTTFSPGKLYCWNKLKSSESYYLIAHNWIKNGRRVRRQPIQVRGRTWVTWSYFKVTPGSWTVRVTDGSGMLLESASFTVK